MAFTELPLADTLARPLRDLRISVTDRCQFRCTYCMPREVFGRDFVFLPREQLLTFEELTRLARVFAGLGVRKLRLTGGEPLLRRDLDKLVVMLAGVEGIADIALTTNGALLAAKAQALKAAGLARVTVSLDSLDDAVFMALNDASFPVAAVLEAITAAVAAGLVPVKVNMVVKRGCNEDSILPMAAHFRHSGNVLRFIEYMDVGTTNGWRMDDVVPAAEIIALIGRRWPLEPVAPAYPGEVAGRYRYRDGAGEIGLIASVTQPFCRGCTRARLSADGQLFTCLFAGTGHDLRGPLRTGASDQDLRGHIAAIWARRTDRYSELRTRHTGRASTARPKVEMSHIGG
jgi:GTP 3',8-cyclase